MHLVERHIINRNHKFWSQIDRQAFLSKNLWNLANYHCRQHFFATGKKLGFTELYHLVSQSVDYLVLPTKVSKQIIRRLDKAWVSFFQAIKAWVKNPYSFLEKPKIPGYKDKTKGRNIVPYPGESVSKKAVKKGICQLSMCEIAVPTKASKVIEARIIPKACCYVLEIVYEQETENLVSGEAIAGVDLGIDNLMAVTSNQAGVKPLLINGKPLKSINQLYNKRKAKRQAIEASRQIRDLTHKRNCRVDNYLHTASRRVIDWCLVHGIGTLIIGKNEGWKQKINIGRRNNQEFVSIPHARLIEMLSYKAELVGIKVVITEEAYTSVASALDNDPLPKYGEAKPKFSGNRIFRGLYKTGKGLLINADTNGSLNIARKVIPDFIKGIEARPFVPVILPLWKTYERDICL
ncbi:MAG TPA: transposase [Cyanobacteria bacterium UBA8553]|nr:transposase [Cyanobacteria bacterium UBA8553]HAJ63070.1 transposase [Cyanobacteria bacterium UBA8543]